MPRTEFEMIEKQIDKALACGQLARVAKVQEELGEAQIVSPFEHLVPGERLFSQVEDDFRERRIVVHAGHRLAHLGQHAVVADPAIEAVQLKIDADVRVQIVIPDRKRERRGSRWS
jgi:hypothetical protein